MSVYDDRDHGRHGASFPPSDQATTGESGAQSRSLSWLSPVPGSGSGVCSGADIGPQPLPTHVIIGIPDTR